MLLFVTSVVVHDDVVQRMDIVLTLSRSVWLYVSMIKRKPLIGMALNLAQWQSSTVCGSD